MRFDVLTMFPEIFSGFLSQSILHDAIQKKLIQVQVSNLRDWAKGKHKTLDDRPYGGGPGMVILPEPVFDAVEAVQSTVDPATELILLTPSGRRFNQQMAKEFSSLPGLIFLCGRYEGFDERVRLGLKPREVSIGDFVCNGGEVPAMIMIEAIMRLIPGVLGDLESTVEESHSEEGVLEYPHYTRPREFRGMMVPEVLLSGNHQLIQRWRQEQSKLRSQGLNHRCDGLVN